MLKLEDLTLRLHPADNVVVVKRPLKPGVELQGSTLRLVIGKGIPPGHKIAVSQIPDGAPVTKYGQTIGFAKGCIMPGDHVHTHNVELKDFGRDYAFGVDARRVAYHPASAMRQFRGYARPTGKVGTMEATYASQIYVLVAGKSNVALRDLFARSKWFDGGWSQALQLARYVPDNGGEPVLALPGIEARIFPAWFVARDAPLADLVEKLGARVRAVYEEKESRIGPEFMRFHERMIMLQVLDTFAAFLLALIIVVHGF